MTNRRFLISPVLALLALLAVGVLYRPLNSVEEHLTAARFSLRGEQEADTNIIIIHIDNEATRSLGWPVRRNFYALMVQTLNKLQVRAIGIDVLFEDQNLEYPEYDDLFANVIRSARNVVVQSYFQSLSPSHPRPGTGRGATHRFSYSGVTGAVAQGYGVHLPLASIADAAAGIGHVNLVDETDIPVFVGTGDSVIPSFGMELLRVFTGAEPAGITFTADRVSVPAPGGEFEFTTSAQGTVQLKYPGKLSAFKTYPFLAVLKSYDTQALQGAATPTAGPREVPVDRFKGKIVLIGVIAEGRSEFRATPVDARYPATVLHAVFLDNALRSGFLRSTSLLVVGILCFVVGLLCSASILFLPRLSGNLIAWGIPVAFAAISFVLFLTTACVLPIMPVLMASLITITGTLLFKHRLASIQVDSLRNEKESILIQLKDREAKLSVLEHELADVSAARSRDRTQELLEEIRRYKAEIRALSSRADDMAAYAPDGMRGVAPPEEFEGIVFSSRGPMRPIVEFVRKISTSEAPVLLLGESGTGKELIARAIHKHSTRSAMPFVAVNCGALAENLLESELFGHERGAFTGAVKDKPGRFELADGGTIFLDEIGEVSEAFQLKLLRVLQEGEFERVGGTRSINVDVRVIAATNKDLKEAVESRTFRQDLYYRLNVLALELPPLHRRPEDIPLLADHFLRHEGGGLRLSKNVMEAFSRYAWPGNIREMESVIKRAVLMARADQRTMIATKDLSEELSAAAETAVPVEDQILESLREKEFSRSSISETADDLGGLNRGTVAEYLRGQCLAAFLEHEYDLDKAVRFISHSAQDDVNRRVHKKIREYLANIAEVVDQSQPWEATRAALQPKMKNLPQKYHKALEQVAEAYYRGLWKFDPREPA